MTTEAPAAADRPLIIAMKGHPGTGKSTLARYLATTLRAPLLDKDDIKDSTFPLASTTPPSLLNDLSYSILFNLVATQLHVWILAVIVDSPLSSRSHLEKLVELGGRVVVVECRAENEEVWKSRLEERGREQDGNLEKGWHKPRDWETLMELVESYGGRERYEMVDSVWRFVVDVTVEEEVVVRKRVLEFVGKFVDVNCSYNN